MTKRAKTGGRRKGTPNRITREIGELARELAPAAIRELARLSVEAASEAARISAIGMLLDRAYGKPRQAVELTGKDGGAIEHSVISDAERFTSAVAGLAAREGADEVAEPTQH